MKLGRPGVREGGQRVEDVLSTRRESLGKMVAVPIFLFLGRENGGGVDRGF